MKLFLRLPCPAIVLSLLLAAWPGEAGAQAEFKTHYDLALALYQAQKYRDAIPEFEAAYRVDPRPALLFNIAQSYRKAGQPKEAIAYYDRYLEADPKIDSDTRRKVDGYLAEARNTLASLELTVKQRLAEEKAIREQEVEPAPAREESRKMALDPAPAAQALPAAAVSVTQPAPRPVYKRWWFWTAIGGAVLAGAAVGIAVGVTRPSGASTTELLGLPSKEVVF